MKNNPYQPSRSDLNSIFDQAHKIYLELSPVQGGHTLDPRELIVKSYFQAVMAHLTRAGVQLDVGTKIRTEERTRAVKAVMDLYSALRKVKGQPTMKDLVKLAKRIKR